MRRSRSFSGVLTPGNTFLLIMKTRWSGLQGCRVHLMSLPFVIWCFEHCSAERCLWGIPPTHATQPITGRVSVERGEASRSLAAFLLPVFVSRSLIGQAATSSFFPN